MISNSNAGGALARSAAVLMALLSIVLGACAGAAVPAGRLSRDLVVADEDAFAAELLIASPTPTFALPDPDDEDPIHDCALEVPLCRIGVSVEEVGGQSYVAVEVAIQPNQLHPGGVNQVSLVANVEVAQAGQSVGVIEHEGTFITTADQGIHITSAEGTPIVQMIFEELPEGYELSFAGPGRAGELSFSYEESSMMVHNASGDAVAGVQPKDGGVAITDPEGTPLAHISTGEGAGQVLIEDLSGGAGVPIGLVASVAESEGALILSDGQGNPILAAYEQAGLVVIAITPFGNPIAAFGSGQAWAEGVSLISPKIEPIEANSLAGFGTFGLFDSGGEISAFLSLQENGRVVISGPDGAPVAGVNPKDGGAQEAGVDPKDGGAQVAGIDPKDNGRPVGEEVADSAPLLMLTALIPMPAGLSGEFDLAGGVALYATDAFGERSEYGEMALEFKGLEIKTQEQPGKPSGGKPVPSPTSAKGAGGKATQPPTRAVPTATPVPTISGGKATATPGGK